MKTLKAENVMQSNFDTLSNFIYSINNNRSFVGSDNYLDIVIKVNKSLDGWINEINKTTNLFKNYVPPTKEKLLAIANNLYEVYKTLSISLSLLKKNEIAYKSLKSRILALEAEAKQIQQVILNMKSIYLKNTIVLQNS